MLKIWILGEFIHYLKNKMHLFIINNKNDQPWIMAVRAMIYHIVQYVVEIYALSSVAMPTRSQIWQHKIKL